MSHSLWRVCVCVQRLIHPLPEQRYLFIFGCKSSSSPQNGNPMHGGCKLSTESLYRHDKPYPQLLTFKLALMPHC